MGEYAKHNDQEIKIGTCESMYYLRWEDRGRVEPLPHNLDPSREDGLRFRLPLPDEDDCGPGGYSGHIARFKLYRREDDGYTEWFEPKDLADAEPGSLQLKHESGLLVGMPCHHGTKLPEVSGCGVHWNGKGHFLELSSIKNKNAEHRLVPVVECIHCGTAWAFEWADILPYCEHDPAMYARLIAYSRVGQEQAATTQTD